MSELNNSTITNEQLARKLDSIIEAQATIVDALPTIDALGKLLIRRHVATKRIGLNKNTLNSKEAWEEIGKVKTFIEVGELRAVRKRKKP